MSILVSKEEDKQVKLMELPIEEMDLSVRSYNCLKRAGVNTIQDEGLPNFSLAIILLLLRF